MKHKKREIAVEYAYNETISKSAAIDILEELGDEVFELLSMTSSRQMLSAVNAIFEQVNTMVLEETSVEDEMRSITAKAKRIA